MRYFASIKYSLGSEGFLAFFVRTKSPLDILVFGDTNASVHVERLAKKKPSIHAAETIKNFSG
jgi:hypothetical protein